MSSYMIYKIPGEFKGTFDELKSYLDSYVSLDDLPDKLALLPLGQRVELRNYLKQRTQEYLKYIRDLMNVGHKEE